MLKIPHAIATTTPQPDRVKLTSKYNNTGCAICQLVLLGSFVVGIVGIFFLIPFPVVSAVLIALAFTMFVGGLIGAIVMMIVVWWKHE